MNGHVHEELPALVAGELPPAAAAAVHAHLAACDRCRLDLAAKAGTPLCSFLFVFGFLFSF